MLRLLLLLNPVYVTLFWCLVLNTNRVNTNSPKSFLGKFMAVCFLLYLSHLLYYLPLPAAYHYADPFYQLFNLLVYPMYYIYIRLLTVDEKFSFRKHGIFLLTPALMFVLYGLGMLCMSKEEHLSYLYHLMLSDERPSGIFFYQKMVYAACRLIFIVQGFLCLWFSFRLVAKNKNKVQQYYANTADDTLHKIQWLNISLLVTIAAGILLSVLGKENFMLGNGKLVAPSLVFSVMLFIIGWLGNKQRQVLTETKLEESLESKAEVKKDEMSTAQLEQIRLKVEQLFDEGKIYLNKDLTIWEVSRIAGTNRTYISTVINNDFRQNFSSFVNTYRAKHAKMLLKENPSISKSDLAEMSGFGSVLSMQRALKGAD